jgi:hypothetical protein
MHPTRRITADFSTLKTYAVNNFGGTSSAPVVPLTCYLPLDPADLLVSLTKVLDGATNDHDAVCIWTANMSIKAVNSGAAGTYGFSLYSSVSDATAGTLPVYKVERTLAVGEADTISVNFPKGFYILNNILAVDPNTNNQQSGFVMQSNSNFTSSNVGSAEVACIVPFWPALYTQNGVLTVTYSYVPLAKALNC